MGTPTFYLNQAGIAARANIARQAVSHRLGDGLVPDPDVYIGNVTLRGKAIAGWLPARVDAYLAFINQYLCKLSEPGRLRLRLPTAVAVPSWWHVQSEWFVNQREAAEALGLEPVSISARLSRGTWPVPPRVVIGDRLHGVTQGWDLADLIEYGKGRYLDERGDVADVARSGPPRRRIDPDFYAQQASRRLQPA